MQITKLLYVCVAVFAATVPMYAEVSAFDAGNLNNSNPYGLTSDEKILLHNKKKVETLNQHYSSVDAKVNSIIESIDGIKSIVESNANMINRINQRLSKLETKMNINDDSNDTSDIVNFNDLKKYSLETRDIQTKNYNKFTHVIKELTSLVESINSNYVAKNKSINNNSKKSNFKNKKSSELLNEANDLFNKKKYKSAEDIYKYLVGIKHKPAYCNYMLGEISYMNKSYRSAIKYYQTSISLYDKGDYTSKLLYHTGVSFNKIGDFKNASKVYQILKTRYPKSAEAKILSNKK